jgi:phage-related minor tail protein
MANKKISGLTIAINADTSGVTKGLGAVSDESKKLSNNLKAVDSLLKLDPTNTELLAERQKLLSQNVETTSKKLEMLKAAQEDVNKAFEAGTISDSEYIAFQRELVNTQKRLDDMTKTEDDAASATKNLAKEVDSADAESGKFGETLKNGVVAGAKMAATAVAAVGTAAVAAVTGVVKMASDTAQLGDEIDKQSQKLGMSAEAYQEWAFIMEHSGSDIDKMSTSMKKLAEAATDPSDAVTAAFQKIGMSMDEVAGMSQEELFSATITALQGMESSTERTAIANDLLGKSAMDLGALLNTSAADTEAMRQQVHELGGVMSDDAVKNSAAFQDSLQNLTVSFDGIKNGIASDFLPSLTNMMDGITGVLIGSDEGVTAFMEGLQEFTATVGDTVDNLRERLGGITSVLLSAITDNLPSILGLGVDIVMELAGGITDALPQIADASVDIVTQLVDGLLGILPRLMTAGVDVIVSLANGIAKALPTLIPAAVQAVTAIVQGLSDSLPDIISAALTLVRGLADGLLKAIPALLDALPEIISSLVDGLLSSIPEIIQTGITLLTAIVEALPDIIAKIVEVLPQIVTAIYQAIMDNLPLIVEAGFDLLTALLDDLPGIIGQLVIAIPTIVAALGQALTEMLPQMGEFGLTLFTQLTERGTDIIKKIVELVPKIIENIGASFSEKFSDLQTMGMDIFDNISSGIQSVLSDAWNWGSDLISNFVDGIWANIQSVINAASSIAETVWEYLHFSEPEKGPLANFSSFAPDMMELFAKGIEDNAYLIGQSFTDSLSGLETAIDVHEIATPTAAPMANTPISAPSAISSSPIFTINVNVGSIANDYDVDRMTDQMMYEISEGLAQLQSRQAALVGR